MLLIFAYSSGPKNTHMWLMLLIFAYSRSPIDIWFVKCWCTGSLLYLKSHVLMHTWDMHVFTCVRASLDMHTQAAQLSYLKQFLLLFKKKGNNLLNLWPLPTALSMQAIRLKQIEPHIFKHYDISPHRNITYSRTSFTRTIIPWRHDHPMQACSPEIRLDFCWSRRSVGHFHGLSLLLLLLSWCGSQGAAMLPSWSLRVWAGSSEICYLFLVICLLSCSVWCLQFPCDGVKCKEK